MKALYLGLELPPHLCARDVVHCPLIKIFPRAISEPEIQTAMKEIALYTHIIFTSKSAVAIFGKYVRLLSVSFELLQHLCFIAVGKRTAEKIVSEGWRVSHVAEVETAEGITSVLETLSLDSAYLFWPHSALSREIIPDWLEKHSVKFRECIFYDTIPLQPKKLPQLSEFEEIIFTSPSTVDAFLQCYGALPEGKVFTCQGPVTERYLASKKGTRD